MQLVTCMKTSRDKEISGLYQRGVNLNYTWKYRVNGVQEYFATGTNDLPEAIKRVRIFRASDFIKSDNDFIKTVEKFIKYKVEVDNYADKSVIWARGSLN